MKLDKSGFLLIDALFALMIVSILPLIATTILHLKKVDVKHIWDHKQEEVNHELQKLYQERSLYD